MTRDYRTPDFNPALNGARRPLGLVEAPRESFGSYQQDEPSLLDYWGLVRKRFKLVALTASLFFIIAAIYCAFAPDMYTSDTTVEIRGYAPVLANVQSEVLFGNDTRKVEYQKTTVAKLKLEGLADEVLSRDNLAQDLKAYFDSRKTFLNKVERKMRTWLTPARPESLLNNHDNHFFHKPSVIQNYLGLIDINPIHETNLVGISVTTTDPELSQRIANAHAVGFIEHLQKERQEAVAVNLQLLQRQSGELKDRVTAAEKALADYAEQNKLISLSESQGNTVILREIEGLAGLLAEATSRRIKSESLLNAGKERSLDESSAFDDESTRQLRATLLVAETEYATLGQKVTPEFPEMRELAAKIAMLKRSLGEQRKRMERGLQSQFAADSAAEQKLRNQIAMQTETAQAASKQLIEYNVLFKEAASLRDLYQAVLRQVKEIEISAASTTSNVFVSDFASFPVSPSAPKTGLLLTLFTVLGFAVGIILSIILEALDNTLKSTEEVQAVMDLPVLGVVPQFDRANPTVNRNSFRLLSWNRGKAGSSTDPRVPAVPTQVIAIASPADAVSEALRTIRASILLSSADNPPRVVMVTSATKGEGKSTIVSNLAVTLAQAAHRTLIIDGDLRMSRLGALFGLSNTSRGISDLLTGQADLSQVIHSTSIKGLDVILAGRKAPNPAELLGSQSMRQLITDLLPKYDFILIDSPPVLPVSDSLVMSRLVDSVVIVARSRFTERRAAQECRRRLLRVNARVLGVVLNDIDSEHTENYEASVYGAGYGDAATGS